eukprot:UN05594
MIHNNLPQQQQQKLLVNVVNLLHLLTNFPVLQKARKTITSQAQSVLKATPVNFQIPGGNTTTTPAFRQPILQQPTTTTTTTTTVMGGKGKQGGKNCQSQLLSIKPKKITTTTTTGVPTTTQTTAPALLGPLGSNPLLSMTSVGGLNRGLITIIIIITTITYLYQTQQQPQQVNYQHIHYCTKFFRSYDKYNWFLIIITI